MIVKTPKDIGALIRDARRRAKVSQVELARRVGTTQGWISEVENGKATAEIGKVLKVLVALGVTLDAQETPAVAASKPEPKVAAAIEPKTSRPAPSGVAYDVNDVLKQKAAHDGILKRAGIANIMAGRNAYEDALKVTGVNNREGILKDTAANAYESILKSAAVNGRDSILKSSPLKNYQDMLRATGALGGVDSSAKSSGNVAGDSGGGGPKKNNVT
ncbi:MAG TPA: helix-turn-helix domain-containing protein [Azospirillum sp.]|nr:helix-turn-helix domain-containing protein [Azospirillum sp.]